MYGVVACSSCRQPWLIELRHATVTCPACRKKADVARRTRLWVGADAREGQAAAAALRRSLVGGGGADAPPRPGFDGSVLGEPMVRHDDPVDAAAAQARSARNLSDRSELVAVWLARLVGEAPHDTFVDALRRAGIDGPRAEREIVRMLACDVIFEPRAGFYRALAG